MQQEIPLCPYTKQHTLELTVAVYTSMASASPSPQYMACLNCFVSTPLHAVASGASFLVSQKATTASEWVMLNCTASSPKESYSGTQA